MVYNKFSYDQHGLKQEDIHQELTLATKLYMEICGSYIDIFLSITLDLRSRVVLASKVSFFFWL
jgi:hypothetical protein